MASGRKTGGRKAGVRNKKTQELIEAAAATGELPIPDARKRKR